MSKAETATQIDMLAENGMTVTDPSPELADALAAAGKTMAQEWQERAGESGTTILDSYQGAE